MDFAPIPLIFYDPDINLGESSAVLVRDVNFGEPMYTRRVPIGFFPLGKCDPRHPPINCGFSKPFATALAEDSFSVFLKPRSIKYLP